MKSSALLLLLLTAPAAAEEASFGKPIVQTEAKKPLDAAEAAGDRAMAAGEYRQAEKEYRRSAVTGNWSAQNKLSNLHSNPAWLGKEDRVEAYSWALLSAAHGYSKGLASEMSLGPGLTKAQTAAAQAKAQAIFRPLFMVQARKLRVKPASAAVSEQVRRGAEAFNAGRKEEAVRLFRAAAAAGDVRAKTQLAIALDRGLGAPRDEEAARKLFAEAAAAGDAEAHKLLGAKRLKGKDRDPLAALRHFETAARMGDSGAAFNAGLMSYTGDGVPKDLPQATLWFYSAALLGDVRSMALTGKHFEKGWGVPASFVQALSWYQRAADARDAEAAAAAARLRERMTPQQIKEAVE